MISGVTGEELEVDIYMGLVYYQRLRHMVADKAQVSTAINQKHTQGYQTNIYIKARHIHADLCVLYYYS